jgi:hypothetical protein
MLLYRDFVAVPAPVLNDSAWGLGSSARAVPYDLVVTIASRVLGAEVVQRVVLVASVGLAGSGVGFLLRRRGLWACLAGTVVASWNPYVAERLLVGQPPTLLAYGAIAWIVAAARARGSQRRRLFLLALACAPACVTPFGGVAALVTVGVLAAFDSAVPERGRAGRLAMGVVPLALSLPWLLAGARQPGLGATGGADAFRVGSDGVAGMVGSVMTLGGIWAPAAHLDSRQSWVGVGAAAALVASAVGVAIWQVCGRVDRRVPMMLLGALVLPMLSAALLAGPLLGLWRQAQWVPGVAIVRDTHRLLAWSALSLAVLVGVGVSATARWRSPVVGPGAAVFAVAVMLAVLSAPDLPARTAAAYRPVAFPDEWDSVVASVDDGPPGRVLVLPWQPFRSTDWAGGAPFLDPIERAVHRPVLAARTLTVVVDGAARPIGGDDPSAASSWQAGELVGLPADVTCIVEWLGTPGRLPADHAGFVPVHTGGLWRVWRRA